MLMAKKKGLCHKMWDSFQPKGKKQGGSGGCYLWPKKQEKKIFKGKKKAFPIAMPKIKHEKNCLSRHLRQRWVRSRRVISNSGGDRKHVEQQLQRPRPQVARRQQQRQGRPAAPGHRNSQDARCARGPSDARGEWTWSR